MIDTAGGNTPPVVSPSNTWLRASRQDGQFNPGRQDMTSAIAVQDGQTDSCIFLSGFLDIDDHARDHGDRDTVCCGQNKKSKA